MAFVARPMTVSDLARVVEVHHAAFAPEFREGLETIRAMQAVYPPGCYVLLQGKSIEGYLFAHPSRVALIPPALDVSTEHDGGHGSSDGSSDPVFYVHAVAVHPSIQGSGAGIRILSLVQLAEQLRLGLMALTAVQGAERFWGKLGFAVVAPADAGSAARLASYGASAVMMQAPTAAVQAAVAVRISRPLPVLGALALEDLTAIMSIQAQSYGPDLVEGVETFRDMLLQFPAGCFGLRLDGRLSGYCFSRPASTQLLPPLHDSQMEEGPAAAANDVYYVHDVAVAPSARGLRSAARFLDMSTALAAALGYERIALTAVQGMEAFWTRLGFRPVVPTAAEAARLATYSSDAVLMMARVSDILK